MEKDNKRTFPGMADSHMRTSLLVANSGGLSFTSLTLMLTRTLVSWWWPPVRRDMGRDRRQIQLRALQFALIKNRFLFVLVYGCARLSSSSLPQLTMSHFQQGYLSVRASQAATHYFWFCKNYRRDKRKRIQDCAPQLFLTKPLKRFWCGSEKCQIYMLNIQQQWTIDAPGTWTWTKKWWKITGCYFVCTHSISTMPCIFAIVVGIIFPLPCYYKPFILLPRACERLA